MREITAERLEAGISTSTRDIRDATIIVYDTRLRAETAVPFGSTSARYGGHLIICRRLNTSAVLYGLELSCTTIP